MARFDSQSVYSPQLLKLYDLYVLAFSCRFAWRCSKKNILALYNKHLSPKHLEVGVGSGYFLRHCKMPVDKPEIALFDLNPDCLDLAAKRIANVQTRKIVGDALQALPEDIGSFQSIALNFVLHCIQGDLKQKAIIFDNLQKTLVPGGILYGATILNHGVSQNFLSRKLINLYNQQGVFGNVNDSLEALEAELKQRFSSVNIDVQGSVALFTAINS